MPLSLEQKAEISAMLSQGMETKAIADAAVQRFGCKPIAVYGFLNQEKWKANPESRPASGRPKKVKEETKTTRTYDEDPGIVTAGPLPFPYSASTVSPLFSGIPGVIDKIIVTRIHASPRSAGIGVVGEIDPEATESDLQGMFGGGRYSLKALDGTGKPIRSRSVQLAGRSIPVDPSMVDEGYGMPPMGAGYGYDYGPQNPLAAMVSQLQQQLVALTAREKEDDRLTFEQRLQLERERAKADTEARVSGMQQMMAFQVQAHQQQMQFMQQSSQKEGGMKDTLALLATAKDLFDTGGGGEDPVTAAIQNAPKMLTGLTELIKSRGGAMPAIPGQPQLPAQAGAAPTLEDAALVFYNQLISQGLTPAEAQAELAKVNDYLTKRVTEKQNVVKQQQAQRAAAPRPQPVNNPVNGTAPAPTPAPTVVQPKAEA